MSATIDRASFTRLVIAAAAIVVVLGGMKAAATIVNMVGMAVFLGIVLMPLYRGLGRRTGKSSVAMVAFVTLILLFGLAMGAFLLFSAGQLADAVDGYSERFQERLGVDHPVARRVSRYGQEMITYVMVRTKLNASTGVGVTVMLWALGVDFALLWGC
jgi:predicted PurR-regulated permease PerM